MSTMNTRQICDNLDSIIDKLNKINNSCKNIKDCSGCDKCERKNDSVVDSRDDIIPAGYNGPQRNHSNNFWIGSLRSVWTRY